MKSKSILSILICSILIISILPVTANDDIGPKASLIINFENMNDEPCYGTLLSDKSSCGPHCVWNGDEEDARHNENPKYSYQNFDYQIWKAFAEYEDSDGYYFLQIGWNVGESKKIDWMYYPPSSFKILLYYPETQTFVISGIYEKYAFDSYYTVDMDGINIGTVEYDEKLSNNKRIEEYNAQISAYRSYKYKQEIASLIARNFITILIETVIALFFGFRKKKQILLLIGVNTFTQLLLNILLNIIYYYSDELIFIIIYILLEIIIFAIEAVLYCKYMKKLSDIPRKNRYYILYSLIANTVSFGAGILIAKCFWIPEIL